MAPAGQDTANDPRVKMAAYGTVVCSRMLLISAEIVFFLVRHTVPGMVFFCQHYSEQYFEFGNNADVASCKLWLVSQAGYSDSMALLLS